MANEKFEGIKKDEDDDPLHDRPGSLTGGAVIPPENLIRLETSIPGVPPSYAGDHGRGDYGTINVGTDPVADEDPDQPDALSLLSPNEAGRIALKAQEGLPAAKVTIKNITNKPDDPSMYLS